MKEKLFLVVVVFVSFNVNAAGNKWDHKICMETAKLAEGAWKVEKQGFKASDYFGFMASQGINLDF